MRPVTGVTSMPLLRQAVSSDQPELNACSALVTMLPLTFGWEPVLRRGGGSARAGRPTLGLSQGGREPGPGFASSSIS